MKIRTGFVSNSSSQSFCIYGVQLNGKYFEQINEAIEKLQEEHDYSCRDAVETLVREYNNKYNLQKNERMEVECVPDCDPVIGRSWTSVGDDETGKMFKERVHEHLCAILKLPAGDIKCTTHEEGWFDG